MNGISQTQKIISSVLKVIVFLSAVIGTFLSWYAGKGSFMGGANVFMFFTIQSNIAVALISLIGLFFVNGKKPIPQIWYIIKFAGAISITLTGAVFCFVLAPTMGDAAWNIQNILTHVVVPVAAAHPHSQSRRQYHRYNDTKKSYHFLSPPTNYALQR